MRAIGVAGTAKNTGKTTALVAIMAELAGQGITLAVTSIGYDGEALDHITGLPKPRVHLLPGMLVATAEKTLKGASAGLQPLEGTGVMTLLGEVMLARVERPGLVPIAGPPTGAGIARVLTCLEPYGPDLCLVDGAFGRMAPMAHLDGLILATGAARSRDLNRLLHETSAFAWLFELEQAAFGVGPRLLPNLLSERDLAAALESREALLIAGAVKPDLLMQLARHNDWTPDPGILFADPVRLSLAGDPVQIREALELLSLRCRVGVARRLPLLACTVNPFYPEEADGTYRSGFLNRDLLHQTLSGALNVPVVDVVREGAHILSQHCV